MARDSGSERLLILSAFLGAKGVGLGALGAHALNAKLVERGMLDSWRTAILYQLFHAVAVMGVCALCEASNSGSREEQRLKTAGNLLGYGSLVFSGSIYLLCFGIGPKKILGPSTPIGGLMMLSGWVMLGLRPSVEDSLSKSS